MAQASTALVQQSWSKVAAIGPQAAQLFYDNLFKLDPGLRPLFKGDMRAQGDKLLQVIGMAVAKLDEVETLIPVLQGLGERHAGYGVRAQHYDTVGAALLQTLEQGLAADFTPAVRQAWSDTYALMTRVMIGAAQAQERATA